MSEEHGHHGTPAPFVFSIAAAIMFIGLVIMQIPLMDIGLEDCIEVLHKFIFTEKHLIMLWMPVQDNMLRFGIWIVLQQQVSLHIK